MIQVFLKRKREACVMLLLYHSCTSCVVVMCYGQTVFFVLRLSEKGGRAVRKISPRRRKRQICDEDLRGAERDWETRVQPNWQRRPASNQTGRRDTHSPWQKQAVVSLHAQNTNKQAGRLVLVMAEEWSHSLNFQQCPWWKVRWLRMETKIEWQIELKIE